MLAVLCALVVASCGGDEPPATTAAQPDPDTTTTTGPDQVRERFSDLLIEALTGPEGLSPETASCVADRLEGSIGEERLGEAADELAAGGAVPAELLEEAFEAGRRCAA